MRDCLNVGLSFDDVVHDPSFAEGIAGRGWNVGEYCDLYQWLVWFMDSWIATIVSAGVATIRIAGGVQA